MSHTTADLESATAKLATLDFTEAETEAIAAMLATEPDEVSGFGFDPNKGNGFLLEVAGLMKGFTATDDLARFTATDDLTKFTATDDLARNK